MSPLHSFVAKEDRAEVAALYRIERFWSFVQTSPDDNACWPWRGQRDDSNYGRFPDGGPTSFAHRVAFQLCYGELPDDLDLDHLCHTLSETCPGGDTCEHRSCVRPSHLEPVEHGENTRRAIRLIAEAARRRMGKRGKCKNGHPWIEENLYVRGNGVKRCRICHRDEVARAAAKKRARLAEAASGGDPA